MRVAGWLAVAAMFQGVLGCGPEPFTRSEHALASSVVGDTYRIQVVVPDRPAASEDGYPTVYLLDGDWVLPALTGRYVALMDRGEIPPVVLVGIGHTGKDARQRDYTPTDALGPGSGGGAAFQAFLRGELIPFVEEHYPVSPRRERRCIVGHSFGGLSVLDTFLRQNDLFHGYGAASPSLWYGDGVLFGFEQQSAERTPTPSGRVFIGFGTLEPAGRIGAPDLAFIARLESRGYPDLRVEHEVLFAAAHNGTPEPVFARAVPLCLEGTP